MIYPDNFESRIGFDVIRREIERRCISPLGLSHCRQMRFSSRRDEVTRWLEATNEFLSIVTTDTEFPLDHFYDFRSSLKSVLLPGTYLSAEQLFNLQRSLTTVGHISAFFRAERAAERYPRLTRLASQLSSFPDLTAELSRVLDKFGNVKDSASPLLSELRRALAAATASINGIMRRVISEGRQAGIFDGDTSPAVRDGRLVLPVPPMHKRKVKGIVHDESATGKTVFIEPEEIVEANNHIREAEAEIAREIIRILTEVTDLLRPHIPELDQTFDVLGEIDFIRAKALFARDIDAQMPNIDDDCLVEWYHAVHPALWLSLKEQGKEVVPLNIELNREQRILIISGPNAGGKSVCLKTVGVVQYMMQCGILPTLYSNSHMGIFKSLFIDIGDQQSIEDDLSTYSSHLQNMKFFLTRGDRNTLILIDEFGSGTEPQIGGALAQAILDRLNRLGIFGVITTHYHNLKHFADETPGLVNGAMLYDRQKMQPMFSLSIGYPGSSFAIEIARKIGLPAEVVEHAAQIVGSDYVNLDRYLLDIVRDRKYWENKRHEIRVKEKKIDSIIDDYNSRLEKINAEQKVIIKQAKSEARDILAQSNAQIERTIKEIKEVQAEKDKTAEVRRQLEDFKKRLESDTVEQRPDALKPLPKRRRSDTPKKRATAADLSRPLAEGDSVTIEDGDTVGVVLSADEKYAMVAFGNIKTRVETSKLRRTLRKPTQVKEVSTLSRATTDEIRARQLQFRPDIDVRGMRGDEAVQAITYFIDDAIQFNVSRVRILHGTGTGVLKQLIRQYLATIPGVKSYRDEHVQFGGAGITIVELG